MLVGSQALLVLPASAAESGGRDDSVWRDLEGRIQYGYYTEDLRTLESLANPHASAESADPLTSYYRALAQYRLTQLLSAGDPPGARERADQCVESLGHALEAQPEFADAHALQSACLALVAQLKPLRAPLASSRSRSEISRALRLAPRNPRVLLLDAINDSDHASSSVEKDRALGKLRKAVAALEAERADLEHVPGWGLAEGYTCLAQRYLDKGDALAAREALEHALLAAPDFAQARRLMTRITSG
jgi:hypothetical protein